MSSETFGDIGHESVSVVYKRASEVDMQITHAEPKKKYRKPPANNKQAWKYIKQDTIAHFLAAKPAMLLHALLAETLYRDSENHIRFSQTVQLQLMKRNEALLSAMNCLTEGMFIAIISDVITVVEEKMEEARKRAA